MGDLMAPIGFKHGTKIYWDGKCWRYADDNTKITNHDKPCPHCGRMPTKDGHDGCLGELESVISACCGHGRVESYVIVSDEDIRFYRKEMTVEEYKKAMKLFNGGIGEIK
ncbi:hypothetical protein DSECCO2_414030 [anaerobic digester metagenome]